jgi:hypothetical protein
VNRISAITLVCATMILAESTHASSNFYHGSGAAASNLTAVKTQLSQAQHDLSQARQLKTMAEQDKAHWKGQADAHKTALDAERLETTNLRDSLEAQRLLAVQAQDQVAALTQQIQTVNADAQGLRDLRDQAIASRDQAQAQVLELTQRLERAEADLSDRQHRLDEALAMLEQLRADQGRSAEGQAHVFDLTQRLDRAEAELSERQHRLDAALAMLEQLQEEQGRSAQGQAQASEALKLGFAEQLRSIKEIYEQELAKQKLTAAQEQEAANSGASEQVQAALVRANAATLRVTELEGELSTYCRIVDELKARLRGQEARHCLELSTQVLETQTYYEDLLDEQAKAQAAQLKAESAAKPRQKKQALQGQRKPFTVHLEPNMVIYQDTMKRHLDRSPQNKDVVRTLRVINDKENQVNGVQVDSLPKNIATHVRKKLQLQETEIGIKDPTAVDAYVAQSCVSTVVDYAAQSYVPTSPEEERLRKQVAELQAQLKSLEQIVQGAITDATQDIDGLTKEISVVRLEVGDLDERLTQVAGNSPSQSVQQAPAVPSFDLDVFERFRRKQTLLGYKVHVPHEYQRDNRYVPMLSVTPSMLTLRESVYQNMHWEPLLGGPLMMLFRKFKWV